MAEENVAKENVAEDNMAEDNVTEYDPTEYGPTEYDAEVAIAILHKNKQFLLQLRDDIPTIVYPGHWAFCGGHLEPGEDADTAVVRELQEEIAYVPPKLSRFRRTIGPTQDGRKILRNFYHGELTVPVTALELNEGQELGLASISDIQRGLYFSKKNQEERPIPPQHQQILLEFIETYFH